MSVVIETTKGDITVDLYTAERPKACLNFLKLCKQKMYNNNLFHMIQNNFIAQTGDPSETGRGGDSIFYHLYGDQARLFEAESNPRIKHTKQGQLSMVNCGENMLGSQFFLTLSEDLDYLDGEHCVFGEVVEGFDIVEVLNETICDSDHRPYQDVRITHMAVLYDPFDDPVGLEPRADSPEPSKELLKNSRIGADENINDYAGKTEEEINEIIAGKEANARATILEMVGDLPDADCAPPENVLFVCKLNPVTNDDDLEIIFSRFGKVKCCEVIRDKKSGESLQYAFVEFEEESACESAYFKMDNVLIDDRRIHVDFSQSVSKFQWKGKGRLEVKDEKESKKLNVGEKNKGFKSNKDDDDKYKQDEDRKYSRKGQGILNLGGKPKDRAVKSDNKDRRDERDYRYTRDDGNRKDGREERDNRDRKVERDNTERRVERDIRDRKEERTNRDKRDDRGDKERRGERDYKDRRDERHNKDRSDERDNRDRRDERDNKDRRDNRDRKGERHNSDRRDERDNKERRGVREDDKRKERSNDYKNSYNGSRDKWDDRRNNASKYDQRSEKKDDRERLEKRKYPEERSKTKEKRDASSSEGDNKRHHKKSKKKSKRRKSDSSSSDSSSSESD